MMNEPMTPADHVATAIDIVATIEGICAMVANGLRGPRDEAAAPLDGALYLATLATERLEAALAGLVIDTRAN